MSYADHSLSRLLELHLLRHSQAMYGYILLLDELAQVSTRANSPVSKISMQPDNSEPQLASMNEKSHMYRENHFLRFCCLVSARYLIPGIMYLH